VADASQWLSRLEKCVWLLQRVEEKLGEEVREQAGRYKDPILIVSR